MLQCRTSLILQSPGVGELLCAVKIPLTMFLVLRAVPSTTKAVPRGPLKALNASVK